MRKHVLKHFHLCCGLGGGAKGFNKSKPIVGNLQAEWHCIGGVDVDPPDAGGYPDDPPGTTYDETASELRAAFPASEAQNSLTTAARDVLAERQRQIEAEGYSPEQDDKYARGELADAGSVYAFWASTPKPQASNITPPCWPWAPEYWKPTNQRHMLIKAAALILAEIERLDRLQAREVRND